MLPTVNSSSVSSIHAVSIEKDTYQLRCLYKQDTCVSFKIDSIHLFDQLKALDRNVGLISQSEPDEVQHDNFIPSRDLGVRTYVEVDFKDRKRARCDPVHQSEDHHTSWRQGRNYHLTVRGLFFLLNHRPGSHMGFI